MTTPDRLRSTRLQGLVRIARLPFMAGGFVVHGLGVVVALYLGAQLNWGALLIGQLVITAVQLMNAFSNDYFDLAADRANVTFTRWTGGSRALPDGLLAPRVAVQGALALAAVALLGGVWLAFGIGTGPWTLPLVVLAILWAWFYSAPPVRMHSRGLGEVAGALLMSIIAPSVGFYLQTGAWHGLLGLVTAPFFFIQIAMLIAVSVPDAAGDATVGKRTLFIRWGGPRTARLYALCLLAGYALFFTWPLAAIPAWIPAVTLINLLPALYLALTMLRGSWARPETYGGLTFWSIHVLMGSMALVTLAFAVHVARGGSWPGLASAVQAARGASWPDLTGQSAPAGIDTSPLAALATVTVPPPAMTVIAPQPTPTLAMDAGGIPPTPTGALIEATNLGTDAAGAPIQAFRVGDGDWKVVLVGQQQPFVTLALDHFRAQPDAVPDTVTLWFVPEIAASTVDPYLNADTRYDGCEGNDWTPDPAGKPPGSGGTAPFSDPGSNALRAFVADAWLVLFYQPRATAEGPPFVSPDSCRQHPPSQALVSLLARTARYAVAPDVGLNGNWVDYLAGEGVASASIKLPEGRDGAADLAGLLAVLGELEVILGATSAASGATTRWMDDESAGIWRYPDHGLTHPLALTRLGDALVVLDGGRILRQSLTSPEAPVQLLAGGDIVEGVHVLEPFDLAADGDSLLALDRGGDVYRLDAAGTWTLERAARGLGDSSSHYYVALAALASARYLVEASYSTISQYEPENGESAWLVPPAYQVDIAVNADAVYLLQADAASTQANLIRFALNDGEASTDRAFAPSVSLRRPRQIAATATTIYVLDWAGSRLLELDAITGVVRTIWLRKDRGAFTAIGLDPDTGGLLLAGHDEVWFVGQPDRTVQIPGDQGATPRLHDPSYLQTLGSRLVPIAGTGLPARDLQLPGAPRHYRLGIHEGVDFYWQPGTQVRAVADGIILRALVDYVPPTPWQLSEWRAASLALGTTPEEALDGYRGRQVWIQHDDGLITRYAHLRWIAPGIVAGASVGRGQLVGEVGNSGSPVSLDSESEDAHLHLEIWQDDQFLGQFLRPIETREVLERLFVQQ